MEGGMQYTQYKDARGFLKHASLSSNSGLGINVEGSEKMRSCACGECPGIDSSPDPRGGSSSSSKGPALSCGSASFAPGTALGESFPTWDGSQYLGDSSEGRHSDFAPMDERQIRLLHYLLARFGHAGVERVCSGIGVPNIYEFLCDEENILERPEIAQLIDSAKDHTKAIMEAAFDPQHPSELCLATVDLLVSILASEAGNLALNVLATGGVYLTGGVALHLVKQLQKPQFVQTFTRKGRFKDSMERTPIQIMTTRAALLGAATFGLQRLSDLNQRKEVKASLAPV
jgi:glucokinase